MSGHTIKAILPRLDDIVVIDIFGYATRGIPGIEIVGLSRYGKAIKEKIVFLTKNEGLSLPPRRYVLCIDNVEELLRADNVKWLELPLLLLYWSLGEAITIRRLSDCVVSGTISISGTINSLHYADRWKKECESLTVICGSGGCSFERRLSLEELLADKKSLSVSKQSQY